jgi:tetratricopeptide (TPR) repeat protein
LFEKGFEAIEELTRQEKIIFFDDAELVTNEDRYFNDFFTLMLNKLDSLMDMPPILIASTFNPKLDSDLQEICHAIKVGPLDEKYIISILERWIKLSDPDIELPSSEDLQVIAKELYGYPLAAKLAATVVANYSVEQTASDLSHFQSIRLDIAKQLIGRSRKTLNKLQMSILEILTIADIGLTQYDISRLLEADSNAVREAIDEMFLDQLVSFERSKIQILPLMKDYFWRRINASNSLTKLSKNIAKHCKNQLVACDPKSEDFVHYCSIACRLFIISDNETEANSLAYYFKGELKEAAKRLYHNKDYELSLKYSNMWLSINPNDSSSRWLKARCLTRLEKYSNAEDELKQLETLNFSPYKLYHAWGLLYRQKGDLEKALWYFQQGLDDRPNYLPLLREKGDVLERMDNLDSAYSVLDLAYNYAPRDPFIAPKYASILEKKGFIDQAINIMEELTITFPDEASFFHRLSMLHGAKGNNEKEYENAKIAVELDSQLTEAITHLASIEIKRENKASAYELLNCLPTKIPFFSRRVRDTIYAEILLKSGKLDEARNKLNPYDYSEDPYCADVLARIEYLDGLSLFNEGQIKLAKARVEKGIKITNSSLEKYPNNYALGIVLENLNQLNGKLTIE